MLSNEWQTDERENVLENHSTSGFAGFYTENNDGIQELK